MKSKFKRECLEYFQGIFFIFYSYQGLARFCHTIFH